jgi:hypothetical protein
LRISNEGDRFIGSHIPGPTHNFLALRLTSSAAPREPEITAHDRHPSSGIKLRADEVAEWVSSGIAQANRELGTKYVATHIEFDVTDSHRPVVMAELARRIVLAKHAAP